MKPNDSRHALYSKHVAGKMVAVSFITVGELLFGAQKRGWGERKIADLERRLRAAVIVPYDRLLCDTYARLKAAVQANSFCVADNDMWIAASAVRHSIPLITHNRKHFENIPELVLISEEPIEKEINSQMAFPTTEGER